MRTEDYIQWLHDYVGLPNKHRNRSYHQLFDYLHSKDFMWVILRDQARAEDGKELRWEFIRASRASLAPADWLNQPCSALEMMIGVARRLATMTEDNIRPWFTQLLYNFGIDSYTDLDFGRAAQLSVLDEKLERLNWRTYASDGSGGLFPLDYPDEDQRHIEMWYQMNRWLIEKSRP